MAHTSTPQACVVVPNWNGKEDLPACLDSLLQQSAPADIVVVENGSTDGSAALLAKDYPQITVLPQKKNLGFAGGVNVGIQYALENNYANIALFNNDAVAHKDWLKHLLQVFTDNQEVGIATCKLMDSQKTHLDSTGDMYTTWGLPYPRGRGEPAGAQYDTATEVFGASGGASLYRASLFEQIGLFDEKFFAYYEDVDVSFRAQLAGWKVRYVPKAIAYHQIGATSSKMKGFTTYQTTKNLPMLFWKNTPWRFVPRMFPRLFFAYWLMMFRALFGGRGWPALKGQVVFLKNLPYTFNQRRKIQAMKTVSDTYLWSILTHDLPPNATKLHALRAKWHDITKR